MSLSYTWDEETPWSAAFREWWNNTQIAPPCVFLVLHETASMHICHCCPSYQVSMLRNMLEKQCYINSMRTHWSANAMCWNMPGVLTVGQFCTSFSSTSINCVVPTSKHSLLLSSAGLYNSHSRSSICITPCLRSSHLFPGGSVPSGKSEALVSKHVQNTCIAEMPGRTLSSQSTINTHASLCARSTKAEELLLCRVQPSQESTTWIDENTLFQRA